MPLLNDAKTCYVGTTPITTIMAGSVQVWPKVPSDPGCYPPASSIAFYHFEDDFENSEGSAPALSVQSSAFQFNDGIFGKCISPVDPSTPSELTANVGSIIRPLTLDCWFKVSDKKDSLRVGYSSKNINDPDLTKDSNVFGLKIQSGSVESRVGYFNPSGSGSGLVSTFEDAGIILGEWFHVAAAFDLSATKQYIWINGNFQSANFVEFSPRYPMEEFGISASVHVDTVEPIEIDELRLSKEVNYPLHDIFPCREAPDFEQVGMKLGNAQPGGDKSLVYFPVSWSVESSDCGSLPEYEARWAYSSNYPGGDGSTPPISWRSWEPIWGSSKLSVLDPVKRKIYWANPYAEMDGTGQGYYVWNEVREKESKKIVVPPCQTDVTASEIPYPSAASNC